MRCDAAESVFASMISLFAEHTTGSERYKMHAMRRLAMPSSGANWWSGCVLARGWTQMPHTRSASAAGHIEWLRPSTDT